MQPGWKEFYDKAALFGHDAEALDRGETVERYFTFATLAEGSKLLSAATTGQRRLRQETFFTPPVAARQRLGQGKHDRGEAILFAAGAFEEGDEQGVNNHLPARIKAVSVKEKRIPAGTTWDISVRGAEWGIDDLEELYTTINVGRLVLEPGACITVQGNVCSMLIRELILLPGSAADKQQDFHIGILPTPFSVDLRHGPMDGANGSNGSNGRNGDEGLEAQVSSTMLGHVLIQDIDPEQMNGKAGTAGGNGTEGTHGRNGGMCKIAEITVRSLEGNLRIFSQAGHGGNGGHGGHGGNGGNGGNGSRGYKLMSGILRSGSGGNSGKGGNGARGGNAGHGGLSSNIYVSVPQEQAHQVGCRSLPASGGKGGNGGRAGTAGLAGRNGGEPFTAADGQQGTDGTDGAPGKDGRSRTGAYIFLNEQCVQGDIPEVSLQLQKT